MISTLSAVSSRIAASFTLGSLAVCSIVLGGCDAVALGPRDDGGASDARGEGDIGEMGADAPEAIDAPLDGGSTTCSCPADDATSAFSGPGTYCADDARARASADGCVLPELGEEVLYVCDETGWSAGATCTDGCQAGESGATAACSLPECDCFVRVSWCGASAARHGLDLDPPCRVPLSPEHDEDILGCDGASWVVLESCAMGCAEQPTGTPDACVSDRTPTDPGWPDCPHRDLLHAGLHPEASDRLRCAGVEASRISQTVGSAAASAGYHAADGTVGGASYTAAVDLRTRDLTTAQIRSLLGRLATHGFAAWYRQPGSDGWPAGEAPHIHAVFAGVVMKSQLRSQVRDYVIGRNGLASHSLYRFYTPTAMELETVRLLFTRHYTP